MEQMAALIRQGAQVQAIMSEHVYSMDTRFGRAADFRAEAERLTGRPVIASIVDAEPLGPKIPLEALILAPCTGNTLAKIAHGITDTTVTMAAKAHLRCDRPTVIALASNDAMSANLQNIATLLNRKNVFFVPVRQDDPTSKPHSLVADFVQVPTALEQALAGRQMRKLFL
jgi:dipicolinate synthase subunit B